MGDVVRKPKTHPLTKRHRGYQPSSGLWDISFIDGYVPSNLFSNIGTLSSDKLPWRI